MNSNENCILQDETVEDEKQEVIPETSVMQDIKNLKVTELRAELAARNLSTKGKIY